MNQILVSKKLYVTPSIKRKKKLFKAEFFLSIFALIGVSVYGMSEAYDRNKSEAVSKEILQAMEFVPETIMVEEPAVVFVLNDPTLSMENINIDEVEETVTITRRVEVEEEQKVVTNSGMAYYTIGQINIPSIKCNYPILASDNTNFDELLKIAPCKFYGPDPNEVGNFCIVGHNYRNSKFFSKVPKLENGDIVQITDSFGKMTEYEVYDKYITVYTDTSCTSQLTEGRKEITVITCTDASDDNRVIVKAREKI